MHGSCEGGSRSLARDRERGTAPPSGTRYPNMNQSTTAIWIVAATSPNVTARRTSRRYCGSFTAGRDREYHYRMHLTVQRKVAIAFGLALTILAAIGSGTYWTLKDAVDSIGRVDLAYRVIERLTRVQLQVTESETGQRGYILTGNPALLEPFTTGSVEARLELLRLRRLVRGLPRIEASVDSLTVLVERKLAFMTASVDMAQARDRAAAADLLGGGQGQRLMDDVRDLTESLVAREQEVLARQGALQSRRLERSFVVIALGFAVALLIAAVASAAVVSDVRKREQLAAELGATAQREREANRAKSQFLARMSHELRTPLNSVIGFSQVLLRNRSGGLGEQELSYVSRIRDNGSHLLEIINDILDLARVEAGRVPLELADVDMRALVAETVHEFAARDDVPIALDIAEGLAPVHTDAARLKQILLNLVSNAVKFTERGHVVVRVLADDAQRPLRIDVIDGGIGIPREHQQKIFEPFEQGDMSTARRFGGTGLGLAICQSLAERLGFQLAVASVPGVGSTFSVLLDPAALPPTRHEALGVLDHAVVSEPLPAPPLLAPLDAGGGPPTILVVDDSADARALLGRMLEEAGARVLTAADGAQGTAVARSVRPDVIVLDLLMPGLDGWQVLERLRGDPATASIPVVLVTALARTRREELGDDAVLVEKPVSRERLLAAVRQQLARAVA
jgi:signal transduction histidine kinase